MQFFWVAINIWKYNNNTKILRNRIGNWKHRISEHEWKTGKIAFENFHLITNDVGRYLTAEAVKKAERWNQISYASELLAK